MPLTTALLVFPPLQIGDRNGELTAQVNMAQLRAALGLGPGDEDVGAAHPCSGYEAQGEFLGFWGHWEVSGITRCGEGEAFASGQEIQMPEQDEAVKCLRHKGSWDVFALCFSPTVLSPLPPFSIFFKSRNSALALKFWVARC